MHKQEHELPRYLMSGKRHRLEEVLATTLQQDTRLIARHTLVDDTPFGTLDYLRVWYLIKNRFASENLADV